MSLETEINIIISNLDTVCKAYLDYDKKKYIAVRDLRDKAMNDRLAEIVGETRRAAALAIASMERILDNMITEVEKNNDYDPSSSAVADAARLLSVDTPDFVTCDAVEKIIEKFRGNQVALRLIYASATDSNKAIIRPWIFDNVAALRDIRKRIVSLEHDPVENYTACIGDIRCQLQEFARRQGIDTVKLTDAIEELRFRNIYAIMGLDYAKNHPEDYKDAISL